MGNVPRLSGLTRLNAHNDVDFNPPWMDLVIRPVNL